MAWPTVHRYWCRASCSANRRNNSKYRWHEQRHGRKLWSRDVPILCTTHSARLPVAFHAQTKFARDIESTSSQHKEAVEGSPEPEGARPRTKLTQPVLPLVPLGVDVRDPPERPFPSLHVVERRPVQRLLLRPRVDRLPSDSSRSSHRGRGRHPPVTRVRPSPEGEHAPVRVDSRHDLEGAGVVRGGVREVSPPCGHVEVGRRLFVRRDVRPSDEVRREPGPVLVRDGPRRLDQVLALHLFSLVRLRPRRGARRCPRTFPAAARALLPRDLGQRRGHPLPPDVDVVRSPPQRLGRQPPSPPAALGARGPTSGTAPRSQGGQDGGEEVLDPLEAASARLAIAGGAPSPFLPVQPLRDPRDRVIFAPRGDDALEFVHEAGGQRSLPGLARRQRLFHPLRFQLRLKLRFQLRSESVDLLQRLGLLPLGAAQVVQEARRPGRRRSFFAAATASARALEWTGVDLPLSIPPSGSRARSPPAAIFDPDPVGSSVAEAAGSSTRGGTAAIGIVGTNGGAGAPSVSGTSGEAVARAWPNGDRVGLAGDSPAAGSAEERPAGEGGALAAGAVGFGTAPLSLVLLLLLLPMLLLLRCFFPTSKISEVRRLLSLTGSGLGAAADSSTASNLEGRGFDVGGLDCGFGCIPALVVAARCFGGPYDASSLRATSAGDGVSAPPRGGGAPAGVDAVAEGWGGLDRFTSAAAVETAEDRTKRPIPAPVPAPAPFLAPSPSPRRERAAASPPTFPPAAPLPDPTPDASRAPIPTPPRAFCNRRSSARRRAMASSTAREEATGSAGFAVEDEGFAANAADAPVPADAPTPPTGGGGRDEEEGGGADDDEEGGRGRCGCFCGCG
ncbi:hypothetical protein ACHAWF_007751 [Thalassiosira exigua]